MDFNSEPTIRSIVEGMLPRFSDNFLGLLMEVDMTYSGTKKLATTPERSRRFEKRKYVYLLFVRPTNYTMVYAIVSDKPIYLTKLNEWKLCSRACNKKWERDNDRSMLNPQDVSLQISEVSVQATHPRAEDCPSPSVSKRPG